MEERTGSQKKRKETDMQKKRERTKSESATKDERTEDREKRRIEHGDRAICNILPLRKKMVL